MRDDRESPVDQLIDELSAARSCISDDDFPRDRRLIQRLERAVGREVARDMWLFSLGNDPKHCRNTLRFMAAFGNPAGPDHRAAQAPLSGLTRLWLLFSFILDQHTRDRVFHPAYEDMKALHIESRRFRTKRAKRWLKFAFACRTILLFGECLRVMLFGWLTRPLAALIPALVRRWWLG